ncbi:MAG: long-chain fatty acid--CoA ligase [Actinomycetota bacterium]|nr:long-chain fatty acid--CoA ligase [Actinomycetota bacterium]
MNAATQGHVLGQDVGWMLDHWASAKPEHPLLVWAPRAGEGRTWTYAQFRTDVRRLAAGLAERGVGKGDHVLIHADNCPEAVLTWYACAVLGAVGVTTNTRSVAAELTFLIAKTQCVAAVTQPQFAELVRGAAPAIRFVAVTADNSGEPIAAPVEGLAFADLFADDTGRPERPVEPMLPAGIVFTSGTTSKPKAVVHTHANVVWAGRSGSRTVDLCGDDVYLMCLPFFHINAQSWCLWSVLGVGATRCGWLSSRRSCPSSTSNSASASTRTSV